MKLQLTWFGHAAFLAATDNCRILLDPYRTPDVGRYAPIDVEADIVLASHENPKYHSHWDAARGKPVRLNGLDFADNPDGVTEHSIVFRAIRAWESPWRDVPVSMPYFTMGGVSICHSGDLGNILTEQEARPIMGCDIFLAVAGGPPTLAVADMKSVIDFIAPRLVIPMHYQTGKVSLDLQPVDDLAALFPPEDVEYAHNSTISVMHDGLPDKTRLVILDPAR